MSGDRYAALVAQMRDLTHPFASKQRSDNERLTELALCVQNGKDAIEALVTERDDWKLFARKTKANAKRVKVKRDEAVARAKHAEAALREARDMIEFWSAYASDYFKDRHDLAADLASIDAVIAEIEKETK